MEIHHEVCCDLKQFLFMLTWQLALCTGIMADDLTLGDQFLSLVKNIFVIINVYGVTFAKIYCAFIGKLRPWTQPQFIRGHFKLESVFMLPDILQSTLPMLYSAIKYCACIVSILTRCLVISFRTWRLYLIVSWVLYIVLYLFRILKWPEKIKGFDLHFTKHANIACQFWTQEFQP